MDQSSILINLERLGRRIQSGAEVVKARTFADFKRFAQDVDRPVNADSADEDDFTDSHRNGRFGQSEVSGKVRKRLARGN